LGRSKDKKLSNAKRGSICCFVTNALFQSTISMKSLSLDFGCVCIAKRRVEKNKARHLPVKLP
jgi:hypothetical protein